MRKANESFRVSHAHWPRREFNPASVEDLNEYRYFLQQQKWRDTCPFILEWPFINIMQMIEHKIVRKHLNAIIKTETKPGKKK
jgi:hypothetical protein